MARKASSKPDSGSSSTATIGFEARVRMDGIRPVPPKPAWRDSANTFPEGKQQVVSEAKDNNSNFAWVQYFIHQLASHTAMRGSASLQSEASPQVVSEAKDNMVGFVLANPWP